MPESIDTANLIEDAQSFLAELAQNNSRDWFAENKIRYDTQLKRPAELLVAQVARWLEDREGQIRGKLFRPQRDVRFSEDKTPYHVHLHMMWSRADGRVWMFGVSPSYVTAGTGVMSFDAQRLEAYRTAVAEAPGEDLAQMLEAIGGRMDPPELKRVPSPWAGDHQRGELLRRKGLLVWDDTLAKAETADLRAALQDSFARMQPVQDWLARHT
jgi:uncharacterized protein (TIGR02453 family)